MKKKSVILIMLVLLLALTIIPVLSGCNSNKVIVLKVYNAQDYIQEGEDEGDEDVLKDFEVYYEELTGQKVRVQYDTFDTLERAYTIINKRKADYDVFCPSDYIIEKMKKADLLTPLNLNKIPNIENIPPYLLDRDFDRNNEYSVPYMWGTLGILYNADQISEEDIKGWDLLWNAKYKNDILMKDSIRDSVFIATIYAYREELAEFNKTATPEKYREKLNDLVNNITPEKLATVEKELREQYNILYAYEVDSGKDSMINGEALINLAWSGDAVWAIEEAANNGINLDYYIPEEGSNVWFDNWVIPKYAKNVDIAHEFINFICRPDIAVRNMDYIGYTTAVLSQESIEYMTDLDDETLATLDENDYTYLFENRDGVLNDSWLQKATEWGIDFTALKIPEVVLPSKDKTENCVEMTDFGEKQDMVVKMWTRVKALPLGLEVKIFSICLAIAIVGIIAYSIYKKVEKKKLVAGKIEQLDNGNNTTQNNIFKTYIQKTKDFAEKVKSKIANLKKANTKTKDIDKENISETDSDNTQN